MPVLSWLALTLLSAAAAVPTLPKPPKVDGALRDLASGVELAALEDDAATSHFTAKLGFHKDTLFLGIKSTDDTLTQGDLVRVVLHFPEAGATARGYGFRFALDGLRSPEPELGAPEFAQALVRAAVTREGQSLAVEAAFPPRSLPRFPAKGPLLLEVCITYEDRDEVASPAMPRSNCRGGAMAGGALKLPEELRKGLKLKPPSRVEGLEARPGAWVGFGSLRFPAWISADAELTPDALARLVADSPVDPEAAHVPLPARMSTPDRRPLWAVLSGRDPFAVPDACDPEAELRLGLYAVKGKQADRTLEWPAATCTLGRAASFTFDDEGGLSIGYSNGTSSTFTWSGDHFERTELGERP